MGRLFLLLEVSLCVIWEEGVLLSLFWGELLLVLPGVWEAVLWVYPRGQDCFILGWGDSTSDLREGGIL